MLEFVLRTASLMALVAFAVYSILPAFPQMIAHFSPGAPGDIQFAITGLYFGLAIGQLLCGPLSDSLGRKRAMLGGLLVFGVGCLLAMSADRLATLLAGQFVQGLGLGAPRIVTVAMIRDRYSGREMARVMSFVLIVFTLVPTVSPGLGQSILLLADWRAIYQTLIGLAAVASLWFLARQPETLAFENRRPFRPGPILAGLREIFRSGPALAYTVILGLMSGAFIGYLNLSQPILQERYGLGADFPTYFAFFAVAISAASFLNGRLVLRLGMRVLCRAALWTVTGVAPIYGAFAYASANGRPPLWTLILFLMIVLFCFGILIGNLNALALESLGHLAGFASAVVGFCSTMLALPLAVLIGLSYDGSVLSLVAGFALCGGLSTLVLAGLNPRAAAAITACGKSSVLRARRST